MDTTFIIFSALKIVGVFAVLMTFVAYSVLAERKISAWIQDRVGPNRTALPFVPKIPVIGPWLVSLGIFQPIADGLKLFMKEDFTPGHVRKIYFWIAPAVAMAPSIMTLAVIPFGSLMGAQKMLIADLNVGILYTFGIVSLAVYGIVLAGYAANSKYPFLGGIRSSAQMISYEIAMGLSVVPLFMLVGDDSFTGKLSKTWQDFLADTSGLNLSRIVAYQAEHGWFALPFLAKTQTGLSYMMWPFTFLAFVIFLVAVFAETNRLPFDLPESETELVGGYHTEYSSMRFGLFFMGEYAAMIAGCSMIVTLFLGGWTLPFGSLSDPASSLGMGIAHIGIFIGKMLALMGVMIWVRWMLPRFRYDQLMDLGWRRFIPVALANILITAIVLWAITTSK
jgi:NADH-quinone oxidoreductase subunit H